MLKIGQCLTNSQGRLFLTYHSWSSQNTNQLIFGYGEIQNIYFPHSLSLRVLEDMLQRHLESAWGRGRHGSREDGPHTRRLHSRCYSRGRRERSGSRGHSEDLTLPPEELEVRNNARRTGEAKKNYGKWRLWETTKATRNKSTWLEYTAFVSGESNDVFIILLVLIFKL